ncbi:MAG: 50S ribosomal protein L37e [archaeon YNP-LCB-003-016]|jgi:large subunit ribosomal protein L37e|uniref:50S ribosomal protein L37e n=1 Tax=Candidatus Culexarchaeum yellowstonense TaxID=2928963 RepID=UPI0029D56A45|nr:50S ribosomal protein L37e [Candidatus Verstraetearchaeota archaeon]MCR6669053.1 50S ribosomal protein L37e [Candidatus Culexarchaeum yellowstonense]MCR6691007.1 50S ribosomal protein L37e [Candidatus Culexarchaeum yellowstonense]
MVKGTTSFGRANSKKTHIVCRRCGHHSYNIKKKRCAHCGFGRSSKMRKYSWNSK